jgi:transcriptional regulator with XRE-family HTH domain
MDPFAAEIAERVGRRIRRRRRAIDMTQEELAFRAGIHRTQITLIEKGRRMPYPYTLIKIAAGLGISTCQLFEGITWAPEEQVGSFVVDPMENTEDG